jgi:hypothetical protein
MPVTANAESMVSTAAVHLLLGINGIHGASAAAALIMDKVAIPPAALPQD